MQHLHCYCKSSVWIYDMFWMFTIHLAFLCPLSFHEQLAAHLIFILFRVQAVCSAACNLTHHHNTVSVIRHQRLVAAVVSDWLE